MSSDAGELPEHVPDALAPSRLQFVDGRAWLFESRVELSSSLAVLVFGVVLDSQLDALAECYAERCIKFSSLPASSETWS